MNQENQQPEELFMSFQEKDAIFRYKRSQHMDIDEFVKLYFEYKNRPTPEELSELFIADFEKGTLTNRNSGKEITCTSKGYKRTAIKRKNHHVHNLLFTMYYKRWPEINMLVDHRDNNPLNNSISNLYEVTIKQNNNNTKRKNYNYGICIKTFKDGSKKYRVKRCGKHLGYFETHEEAMLVSLAYDKQLEEEGIKPKAA